MEAVAEATELSNITTQHSRIEEIRNRKCDYVVSRAVAPLKDLWRWSRPLLRTQTAAPAGMPGPGLICLKGGDLAVEIQESLTRPRLLPISNLFEEEFFSDKYIVYVPRG